ncbi:hypothetical protein JYQ62_14670 [Nostoc sp. UHCC 0702]|nr:hypothetical protein JYQ62_14670 [Nostoc sp. UHCC 0702]
MNASRAAVRKPCSANAALTPRRWLLITVSYEKLQSNIIICQLLRYLYLFDKARSHFIQYINIINP